MLSFNIKKNLTESFLLFKKEKMIIAPYFIFFLSVHTLSLHFVQPAPIQNNAPVIPQYIFLFWITDLLIKSITILMATDVYHQKTLALQSIFHTVARKYFKLLLCALPLFLPILYISKYFLTDTALQGPTKFLSLLLIIGIIPISLILEFLPLFIMSENLSIGASLTGTAKFVWSHIKEVLLFISLMIFVIFTSFLLGEMLGAVPFIGRSFLSVFFKALGNSFIYVMSVVFYYSIKAKQTTINIAV